MENFAGRLNAFIKDLGISNYKFANHIGISQSLISKLTTSEDVNFRADLLVKILDKYPDINMNWVLTGVGAMYLNERTNTNPVSDIQKENAIEWSAGIKGSKYYTYTKQVSNDILHDYETDLTDFFSALNNYWKNSMIFMQFIYQYDKYFFSSFHFQVFQLAKMNNFNKEDIEKHLHGIFKNLKQITPVINQLNTQTGKSLTGLKKYDFENKLNADDWKIAILENFHGNYEVAGQFLQVFDLIEKIYPDYLPKELK